MSEVVEITTTQVVTVAEVDGTVIDLTQPPVVIEVGYTQPGGSIGDKTFSQAFSALATVLVTHNLGKHPAVTVTSSAHDEVVGDVNYVDNNSLTVTFVSANTGVIYCN